MTHRKYVFASPAWVEFAGRVLEELVPELGEEGQAISICEVIVEVPREINADGCAGWSFYVDGRNVRFHPQRMDDTELLLQGTWELELPGARTVYTPEYLAEQEKNPTPRPEDPNMIIRGDPARLPAWIVEFHNRMAAMTA